MFTQQKYLLFAVNTEYLTYENNKKNNKNRLFRIGTAICTIKPK